MKKWFQMTAVCLAVMTALTGCGAWGDRDGEPAEQKDSSQEESPEESKSLQTRVGSKVPDAFLESDEEDAEEVKAKNFTYNEDNMEYRLVWSDEFDYEGRPDETKWGYDIGGGGWGNNELQYYTEDGNAWVEDGRLILELRKEEMENRQYTSARLLSKGKADWKYAKIEVCAKLPSGLGTWPAIWMMPAESVYGEWPVSGEIDIMEHVGYDQGTIYSNIHTGAYNHTKNTQKGGSAAVEDCSEQFHVYFLEWLPDKLVFGVDGEEHFVYKPTDYVVNPTYAEWPYDENMFLIMNIAFGGSWGGAMGIDEELESARMEVDYVRVYQSPQVCDLEREEGQVENPMLGADGKVLRDEGGKGEVVQLKGTNAGGYLFQEFWMTPTNATANVTDEESVYSVLADRFGKEQMLELVELYQDHYWTEADFDYCKELGMNCIRLPFWYRNFVDENGELLENWSGRLDWFVEEAAKRNLYVILDCHGAPGSQNGSDHSGRDGRDDKEGASAFFFGENAEANQEMYYFIWETIAARYKGNPWVAGYDILNEPYCTYRYNSSRTAAQLHEILWDIYDEAYRRIRAVDPEHLIIMEATWDPVDLPDPESYGWENVMYEYHNYLYDDYDNKAGQQIANMRKKLDAIKAADYNVPSYIGEFAYFNNLDAWDEGVRLLNDCGINWTTWTYKVISEYGNWGIRNQTNQGVNLETDSYEEIADAWSQAGESQENTGLAEVLRKYYKKVYITYQ